MMNRKALVATAFVAIAAMGAVTVVTVASTGEVSIPQAQEASASPGTSDEPSVAPTLLDPTVVPDGVATTDPMDSVANATDPTGGPVPQTSPAPEEQTDPGTIPADETFVPPTDAQVAVMDAIMSKDTTVLEALGEIDKAGGYVGILLLADGGQMEPPAPPEDADTRARFVLVIDGTDENAKVVGVTIG